MEGLGHCRHADGHPDKRRRWGSPKKETTPIEEADVKDLTHEELLAAWNDPDAWDALIAAGHAEKYPEGCRSPGHHCEACTKRLGDSPHRYFKVGARPGYKGRWVCGESRCPYYMAG